MNDSKASAAYHPNTGPAPIRAEQEEAEAGEVNRDLAVAARDAETIAQLRELYSWDSFEADMRAAIESDDAETVIYQQQVARMNRTRELLAIHLPTVEEVEDAGVRLMAAVERERAAEAGQ